MHSNVARLIVLAVNAGLAGLLPLSTGAANAAESVETIVLIRHGEKPPQGLGQLNCQGLNRSLRLPSVIKARFGVPAAIFAPNPADQKTDKGTAYDYVRPLATVEPMAVSFGLPVNAGIGVEDISKLKDRLEDKAYANALVVVAWEHKQLVKLARKMMKDHEGDPDAVPKWQGDDFDGIYVVRLTRKDGETTATFQTAKQGLNGLPETCPDR
jgi:broad specificity phosphatase PhoE